MKSRRWKRRGSYWTCLPRPLPSENFTERTLSEARGGATLDDQIVRAAGKTARGALRGGVLILAASAAVGVSYAATRWVWPDPMPGLCATSPSPNTSTHTARSAPSNSSNALMTSPPSTRRRDENPTASLPPAPLAPLPVPAGNPDALSAPTKPKTAIAFATCR